MNHMMEAKLPPSGTLSVSIDPREQSVAIPHLLQLEHALELCNRSRKDDKRRAKSAKCLDVYRAVRSAGQICRLTVPQVAMLAGCGVRECQYALADLQVMGWLEKVQDVAKAGGVVGRAEGRYVRAGNAYRVGRPGWAWDGSHHKHLCKLAKAAGIGVQALHPYLEGLETGKSPQTNNNPSRGAQHAPLNGCTAPAPLSLNLSKSRIPKAIPILGSKQFKERAKPPRKVCTPQLEWPAEAKPFAQVWVVKDRRGYTRPLYCDQAALERWQELCRRTGSAASALAAAKSYLASDAPRLITSHHPLAMLLAAWEQYAPLAAPDSPKPRPALKATPSLLDRLSEASHAH
jgi:hypothetical protein